MNRIYFGFNVNTLVSIERYLETCNGKVFLFTNKIPLGGHFSGVNIEGAVFDNGMTYFEFPKTSSANRSPYNPDARYGWTSVVDEIESYIKSFTDVYPACDMLSFIDNKLRSDYFLSDNLDLIRNMKLTLPELVDSCSDRHPSNKLKSNYWDDISYLSASKACHGHDFNNSFIQPFLDKLVDKDIQQSILARYHRLLWLPLFYPETICHFCNDNNNVELKKYSFYTAKNGIGSFVRGLIDKISNNVNLKIINEKITNVESHFVILEYWFSIEYFMIILFQDFLLLFV